MNYGINNACRLRPKSLLNHDVGGTFYFDISHVSALIEGFCKANTFQNLVGKSLTKFEFAADNSALHYY